MSAPLTLRQAAERLGVSRQRVHELKRLGRLKDLTPEGITRFREEHIPRKQFYERKGKLYVARHERQMKHMKRIEKYQEEQAIQLKRIADTLQAMVGTQVASKIVDVWIGKDES